MLVCILVSFSLFFSVLCRENVYPFFSFWMDARDTAFLGEKKSLFLRIFKLLRFFFCLLMNKAFLYLFTRACCFVCFVRRIQRNLPYRPTVGDGRTTGVFTFFMCLRLCM